MKRLIWFFAIALFSTPVLAQDEGGGGGLPSSLFTGADALGGNRGDKPNPMDAIKRFFAQSKVTLSGDQERAIRPIVETAFRQVQDLVEKLGGNAAGPEGRGFRGGRGRGGGTGARGGDPAAGNPQLASELQKINDDVLNKIVASLKPDQRAAFKKWQNDEIKKGGGFAALKIVMEEAGAPLTPEQEPQIQSIYAEASKVSEPELTTMGKVAKLLTAAQRKALLDSRNK